MSPPENPLDPALAPQPGMDTLPDPEDPAASEIAAGSTDAVAEDRRNMEIRKTWLLYRAWAKAARNEKTGLQWLKRLVVIVSLLSIAFVPLAQLLAQTRISPQVVAIITWCGAVSVGLVAFFNEKFIGPVQDAPWIRARQVAEKIKGETFRCIMRVEPYGEAPEGRLLATASDLQKLAGETPPATLTDDEKAKDLEKAPLPLDGIGYMTRRVDDQITYFTKGREENEAKRRRFERVTSFLGVLSAILLLPGPAGAFAGSWQRLGESAGPLVASVTAALAAHITSRRYKFLADSYENSRAQLQKIRDIWDVSRQTQELLDESVSKAEKILAEENAGWVEEMIKKRA